VLATVADKTAPPLLDVHGLTVAFHVDGRGWLTAVDDVSFSIGPHETVVLVGESGSGKTVTSLAIMGLVRPPAARVSGEVLFGDRAVLRLSRRELAGLRGAEIAMVFQEPTARLNPALKVGEQIAEVLRYHRGLSRRAAWRRAVELLEHVEIANGAARADAYPHELSGGMCQRVTIAIALACDPALLIADEPTTALDVTIQAQILELLKRIQTERGMAMLFVTHDLGIAADIGDRGIVMYAGQVVEDATVRSLFHHPRHPYTEGLLRAMPQSSFAAVAQGTRRLATIPGVAPVPGRLPAGCRFHPRCGYTVEGICVGVAPELQTLADGRAARCVRVDEIELRGV
jgi:peptide/nickel transport system ATP-binding protein